MAVSSQLEPVLYTYSTGFTPGTFGDIPLTTIFTPPPSCLSTITYDGTSLWQNGLLQTGDQNCYPPRFTDIFFSHYNPGICPFGWTSVGNPNIAGPITQSDGNLGTRAFCCPSSVNGNTVYADIIQIQWAATNTDILRLMSQTTSSSSFGAPTTLPQTAHRTTSNIAQTISPTAIPNPAAGSLSAGTKASIGVSALLGATVVTMIVFFNWSRRRRRTKVAAIDNEASPQLHRVYRSAHELDPESEKDRLPEPVELPTEAAHELPSTEGRSELGSETATTRYSTFSGTTLGTAVTVSTENTSQTMRGGT
ncbi:MAG: hypothetical protein Q9219_006809 [cf. Caloplaca sp. 3 TL-2023]